MGMGTTVVYGISAPLESVQQEYISKTLQELQKTPQFSLVSFMFCQNYLWTTFKVKLTKSRVILFLGVIEVSKLNQVHLACPNLRTLNP